MSERLKFSERLELIAFGFVRRQKLAIFPDALIRVILSFYNPTDKWDKACMGNLMVLDESNNSMTHSSSKTGHHSAFLENIIDSGMFHWRFKLLAEGGDNWNTLIGIWKVYDSSKEISERKPPISTWFPSDGNSYTFWAQQGKIGATSGYPRDGKYGIECKKDDIIEMYLNMNEGILGFIINDNDYGTAFTIDKTWKYRAVVSMWNQGTVIQLL